MNTKRTRLAPEPEGERGRPAGPTLWLELAEFDGARELDHRDQMRLRGLITRARGRAQNIADNARHLRDTALAMGVRARKSGDEWMSPATYAALCKPILAREEAR